MASSRLFNSSLRHPRGLKHIFGSKAEEHTPRWVKFSEKTAGCSCWEMISKIAGDWNGLPVSWFWANYHLPQRKYWTSLPKKCEATPVQTSKWVGFGIWTAEEETLRSKSWLSITLGAGCIFILWNCIMLRSCAKVSKKKILQYSASIVKTNKETQERVWVQLMLTYIDVKLQCSEEARGISVSDISGETCFAGVPWVNFEPAEPFSLNLKDFKKSLNNLVCCEAQGGLFEKLCRAMRGKTKLR